jgi:hypothetical protein
VWYLLCPRRWPADGEFYYYKVLIPLQINVRSSHRHIPTYYIYPPSHRLHLFMPRLSPPS